LDHLLSKETAERSNPPSRWSKEAKASGFQLIAQSKFLSHVLLYVIFSATNGVVAQLAEHLLCKQGVASSNLAGSTNLSLDPMPAQEPLGLIAQLVRARA
jgi:hypothetical protein